jgi:hypothetical protein
VCDQPKHDVPPQPRRPYMLHGLLTFFHRTKTYQHTALLVTYAAVHLFRRGWFVIGQSMMPLPSQAGRTCCSCPCINLIFYMTPTPPKLCPPMLLTCHVLQARLMCDRPKHDAPPLPGRPYLLHGLRLAVHFRRGDIAENKRWADRMLSADYFINVVKQIMQVGCCGVVCKLLRTLGLGCVCSCESIAEARVISKARMLSTDYLQKTTLSQSCRWAVVTRPVRSCMKGAHCKSSSTCFG